MQRSPCSVRTHPGACEEQRGGFRKLTILLIVRARHLSYDMLTSINPSSERGSVETVTVVNDAAALRRWSRPVRPRSGVGLGFRTGAPAHLRALRPSRKKSVMVRPNVGSASSGVAPPPPPPRGYKSAHAPS
eukprot:365089-Chlamydomonas_euryale.AAC.11